MFKPNLLCAFALFAIAPAFAQTVAITLPPDLSCGTSATGSTFGVVSATFSASNPLVIGGSPGTGKHTFSNYQLTKHSDACSLPLFTALVHGTINPGTLTINYYPAAAAGSSPTPALTVYLRNFAFTSLEVDTAASEVFYIAYENIEIYDPATKTHFCWNQAASSTGSCPP